MPELDAGQRKELDAQVASNMWSGRSLPMRLLLALALAAPYSLLVSGLAYLASDRWLLISALMTGVLLTCLIPYILAPEWTIRRMFGLFSVSDANAAKPKKGP